MRLIKEVSKKLKKMFHKNVLYKKKLYSFEFFCTRIIMLCMKITQTIYVVPVERKWNFLKCENSQSTPLYVFQTTFVNSKRMRNMLHEKNVNLLFILHFYKNYLEYFLRILEIIIEFP